MSIPRRRLSVVAAPTVEPLIVTLAEARLQVRVTDTAEDGLITAWLRSARDLVEARVGRALLEQRWALIMDGFPDDRAPIELPKPPFKTTPAAVITYFDTLGIQQTWDSSQYVITAPSGPMAAAATIAPGYGKCYPLTQCDRPDAVTVTFSCGLADTEMATLPSAYKTAMLLLVDELFARGGSDLDAAVERALSILAPYALVVLV